MLSVENPVCTGNRRIWIKGGFYLAGLGTFIYSWEGLVRDCPLLDRETQILTNHPRIKLLTHTNHSPDGR